MEAGLLKWCVEELERSFGLSVSEDIVRYILSIDTEEEIDEYVGDLIQGYEEKTHDFTQELKARWRKTKQLPSPSAAQTYKKDESGSLQLQSGEQGKKGRRKGRNKLEPLPAQSVESTAVEEVKTPMDLAKGEKRREPGSPIQVRYSS